MGKVLGGGLPAAAYGGSRELMERVAPAGDVYQAGTLSGNPLAVAAGLATLRQLDAAAYERLAAITERLAGGLREAAGDRPGAGRQRARPGDRLLLRRSGARLRRRRGLRPRRLRPLLPGAARARRLPARRRSSRPGSSRSPTTRRRSSRPSRPPRRRSTRPPDGSRLISRVRMSSTGTSLASPRGPAARRGERDLAARRRPGRGAARSASSPPPGPGPPRRPASTRSLVEAIREGYLLHYGEPAADRRRRPATCACWPATTSTRSGSSGSPRSATSRRCASSPT